VLRRPQRARGAVEHGVDELVTVGRAKTPGERHRLIDRDTVGHLGPRRELVERNQQHRVLDRIEPPRLAVGETGELRIELLAGAPDSLDQCAEVLRIGAWHVIGLAELLDQVLPRRRIQLPAIQRLQGKLARHAARPAQGARTL